MNFRYLSFIQMVLIILIVIFLSPAISLSIMKADTISISGVIETVDRDYKFIIVNKTKIMIQSDTVIVDESGRPLSKERLISKESVIVEAIRISKDLIAQKITIKGVTKKP